MSRPESSDGSRDDLRSDEADLVGQLLDTGNRIEQDAVADRIEWLLRARLERLAGGPGRAALYRDPGDGRLWELTYPFPRTPHGGPPRLTCISLGEAMRKYPEALPSP